MITLKINGRLSVLIDELALHLAQVREQIAKENGEKITVRKYYHQAKSLMRLIPIARPPPVFIISNSDLTPRLRIEIESIRDSPITLRYVLTQSIGRIFENLDFRYYHLSLARNLRINAVSMKLSSLQIDMADYDDNDNYQYRNHF